MIAVRENNEAIVVEVDGEFAERSLEEFNGVISTLIKDGNVRVILNLKRSHRTSLKALKWLVGNEKKLRAQNGDLKLAGLNPYMSNLLEVTGTKHVFDVYSTVEDALASYRLVPQS